MHRVDPFLASTSHETKSKESFVNTIPLDAEVTLATLVPVKSKESQHDLTSRPLPSYRSRLLSGAPSVMGNTVPRGSFMRTNRGERQVMEPIRMLHHCIRYFASHPELYGTNIRALLDRELMYVMRVKASETALLTPGAIPVADTPLPPIGNHNSGNMNNNNTRGKESKLQHPALSKCAGWMVTPRSIDAAVSAGTLVGGSEGMFGFGGTSFVEATPGFLSLLDKASRRMNVPEELCHSDEYEDDAEKVVFPVSNSSVHSLGDKSEPLDDISRTQEGSHVRFISSDESRNAHASNPAESGAKILIDGASYEISFLRSQLQQVEAAFNAKCINLHELQNENNIQKAELQSTEKKLQQCTAKNQELQFQMENMKRELDAWKQRASELNLHKVNASQSSGNVSRRLEAMQFGEAKRELAHLSKLWRETEKSLQETRRALESAEKEADISHKYLEDAFNLIERLERRNARRDKYIESQRRLRISLEEKYEKLMWCVQELQTMKGLQSYVDFLLSENPIWSLFLFVRLQRRLTGFAQVDEPLPSFPQPLYFRRTPCGGKLVDAYSPKLVYRLMLDHISGRVKSAESKFHVKFGIPTPRWRATYLIDYLGGHINRGTNNNNNNDNNNNNNNDNNNNNNNNNNNKYGVDMMEGGDRKRRNLPLLTLSSILLPQQNEPVVGDIEIVDDVPNTSQYDQATIRLLLYCFWSERLMQYKRETEKRLKKVRESKSAINEQGVEIAESKADSVNAFNRPTTFIAALVDFVQHLYPPPNSTTEAGVKDQANPIVKKTIVRGVSVRNSNMRENLRVYFSSIVQITEDGTETPVTLSTQARELLYAMYYYAEEYKEADSDYRLFYLVAFQQIPEIVAVNFYASMEALRKGCDEALCRFLSPNTPSDPAEQYTKNTNHLLTPASTTALFSSPCLVPDDAPADVLRKAVELIDTAPLDEEGVCMEPDSDGEGFGLILPGRRSTVALTSPTAVEPEGEAREMYTSPVKLKHNIREYLFPSENNNNNDNNNQNSSTPTSNKKNEGAAVHDSKTKRDDLNKEMPTPWVSLNDRLAIMLGSHSSMLESFKESKKADFSKVQSRKRQQFGKESVSFSVARGLLPIEEILALVHKHCFTTYAVSCCGGAYLSLVETLVSSDDNDSNTSELGPLTPIGQIPPTEMHLRRLRFAIAMDQPSSLVRFSDLFNVDSKYGTPSHFHDEYLRLTLDTYLEQQENWMNIVLGSITNQYEGEDKENVEDSDGSISFPALRTRFANELRHISLGFEQSNIFAKHFLNYSNLLYHEEDIRHEQFVDAPFFFNTPTLSQEELDEDILLMQERRWPIEDEASSCSLLYLALAVRMTYVVWGFDATPAARLSISLLPYEKPRIVPGAEFNRERKNTSDEHFIKEVKQDFHDALRRMKTGQTQHNSLRRLLLKEIGSTSFSPRDTNTVKLPLVVNEISDSTSESEISIDIRHMYAPWDNELQQQHSQSERGSVARSGRRSRSRSRSRSQGRSVRPETPRVDLSTSDAVYFPETVSLLHFLGFGRVNKVKPEKKKKRTETVKGTTSDVQNVLLGTCLLNETLFMSHQSEMAKQIAEAPRRDTTLLFSPSKLSTVEPQTLDRNEMTDSNTWALQGTTTTIATITTAEEREGGGRADSVFLRDATQPLSVLPQFLDDKNGEDDDEDGGEALQQQREGRHADPTAHIVDSLNIRMVHAGCAALSLM